MKRPKTRGELRDLLERGETCEVVTSNVDITRLMLHSWLRFTAFTVRPSENEGWSLFVPTEARRQVDSLIEQCSNGCHQTYCGGSKHGVTLCRQVCTEGGAK